MMKMNRSQMLSVLNSMSDENLCQALAATGVETGMGPMDYGSMGEDADGLESWNARDVHVEAAPRAPLIDKSKFEKPTMTMKPTREYVPEEAMGIEEFMPLQGQDGVY